ncbi:hypothetical protein LCGC14_1281950 [marine sediment metagenome]|uniref:Uncharacterized protein n=1 Tax=marine sediment metagenome TaxID=412755 RepID=A0A0F9NBH1_9ZZZZ
MSEKSRAWNAANRDRLRKTQKAWYATEKKRRAELSPYKRAYEDLRSVLRRKQLTNKQRQKLLLYLSEQICSGEI